MRAHWRVGHRRGLATLAALSLVLVTAPGSVAEETEGAKNLSMPVILADEDVSAMFNPTTVPDAPNGNADYTVPGGDLAGNYYTSKGSDTYPSTVDQSFDADLWGADWVYEDTKVVGTLAKWGDNLVSSPLAGGKPVRVEVNLFADEATAASYGDLEGYEMVSLEGAKSELFGTLGVAAAMSPMVFTPKHKLTILKYDPATRRYTIPIYDGPMGSEVNGSGKLIYGFNWSTASSLGNAAVGNYRLIFTVARDSLVSFTGLATSGEDSSDESSNGRTPMLYGDKVLYLDLGVGGPVLNPPLPFGPGPKSDFTGDHKPDVVARNSAGRLFIYPGNGTGGWLRTIALGYGWNAMTAIVAVGDWNGDDCNDLIARDASGRLYLYPGNGIGGFRARVAYGYGWNAMTAIVGVGDWNGDGAPDVMARESTGRLYLYPGNGAGGWLKRVPYGYGWNAMTSILGVGDFNSDDAMDLVARDTAGKLWLYKGNGVGGFLGARVLIGSGWAGFTALVAPGDFSGDGNVDVITRNRLGQLHLFQGDGNVYWKLPAKLIGSGWNIMTAIVS